MCVCVFVGEKEIRGELSGERLVSAVCSAWGPKCVQVHLVTVPLHIFLLYIQLNIQ